MDMSLFTILSLTGCFALLGSAWWLWSIRQTPIQNKALVALLRLQADACWLTDDDGRHLWHNDKAGCPATTTNLRRSFFSSKSKPRGSIKCKEQPVFAARRMILPQLGAIFGSNNAIWNTKTPANSKIRVYRNPLKTR